LTARQRNPDGSGLADCIATVEVEVAVPYSGAVDVSKAGEMCGAASSRGFS
jgi:hypothetical protein